MTPPRRNPGIEEHIAITADTARRGTCLRCVAPVIRARAGRIAALDVTADPAPLTPIEEILVRLNPNRLTWCLAQPHHTAPARLLWRDTTHIASGHCDHLVIADHECQPQLPVQGNLL